MTKNFQKLAEETKRLLDEADDLTKKASADINDLKKGWIELRYGELHNN